VVDFDMDKGIHIEERDRNMGFHMERNKGMGFHMERNMEKGDIGTAGMHIEEKK
jgi:hypothetical protein